MRKEKRSGQFGVVMLFRAIVFLTLLVNCVVTSLSVYFLIRAGVLSLNSEFFREAIMLISINATISIPVGLVASVVAVKFPLKPIRELIDGMNALASGNFNTRVCAGPIMRRYPPFVELADSFNKMAEELENTEMLRGDFINNFSHEFKTPIVSIAGFAKLLKRGNLSREQQREYLDAIEEESMRLSSMATNVMSQSKVENQTILTDISAFNLSEQLRSCILLLESKWVRKDLELQLEFGEHTIRANEELLKQVWINLLDNAVKFTPDGHTIRVCIHEKKNTIQVAVTNTGSEILPEHQKKIFQKFYQADESRSTQGSGVGLAIVQRIVQLHGGNVRVSSENEVTSFVVELPKIDK